MKFRIGQRVKKVRGRVNVGLTGVVVGSADWLRGDGLRHDIEIRFDSAWRDFFSGGLHPATRICSAVSAEWEPITDSDQSAEETRELGRDLIRKLGVEQGVPA